MKIKSLIFSFAETLCKVIVTAVIVMYVYRFAKAAHDFGFRVFTEEPVSSPPGIDMTVEIPVGSDARDIGRLLEQRGLIHDGNVFFVQELLSDYRGKIRSGAYTLNTAMTADEMMAEMAGEEETEAK